MKKLPAIPNLEHLKKEAKSRKRSIKGRFEFGEKQTYKDNTKCDVEPLRRGARFGGKAKFLKIK